MSDITVDEYIDQFDGEVKKRLETMRTLVRKEVPEAKESYSYGLVGYKLHGKPLVYFGGFKHHVGFYATPNGHQAFAEDFSKYVEGKGSVQFPLDEPLPVDLIRRVVRYREENINGDSNSDGLPFIGNPAASALAEIGVTKASQLKKYTEQELLAIHGVGPKAIKMLQEAGIQLKEKK